jgi:hypothetical protein
VDNPVKDNEQANRDASQEPQRLLARVPSIVKEIVAAVGTPFGIFVYLPSAKGTQHGVNLALLLAVRVGFRPLVAIEFIGVVATEWHRKLPGTWTMHN